MISERPGGQAQPKTPPVEIPVKLTMMHATWPGEEGHLAAGGTLPLELVSYVAPGMLANEWRLYAAAELTTEDPATDPLGIGINTNEPVPGTWDVQIWPATGTFAGNTALAELIHSTGGSVPVGGGTVYLVFAVLDEVGDPWVWTSPLLVRVH